MSKKSITFLGISLFIIGTLYAIQNTILAADTSIVVKKASIVVGGEFYAPEAGPVVHGGETPAIIIGLLSSSTASISIIPKIKIYDRVITGTLLYSTTTATLKISAGSKATFSAELPIFDGKPAVYVGTINFVDAATGISRAQTVDFRYIVGDDIVKIQSIDTGLGLAKNGQTVNVSIVYSGSTNAGSTTVAVRLFNEKGTQIGQTITPIDIAVGTQNKIVPIVISADSRALRADTAIIKDGKTISSFSTSLVPTLDSLSKTNFGIWNQTTLIIAVVLLVILFAFIFWFAYKKYKKFR